MFCTSLFWERQNNILSLLSQFITKLIEEALEDSHDDVSKSFLETLKEAAFLYVDLQKLEQVPPKDRNFKWALYYLMMRAASDSVGEEAEDPDAAFKACYTSSSRLARKLRSILNIPSSQYLVIAFDEIGALEAKADKYDFDIHPVVGIRPYNDFLGIIRELCELDNLFFLVVGKSNGLSIQNYATSVSRVLLEFIPLSPLDSSSIKEHLEKSPTTLPNRPLVSEFLCGASLRVEELADALLEYTGGVPGLLTRAVNHLLNYVKSRKEPLSKDNFFSAEKESFDMLLMMALYHIPFPLESYLTSEVRVFDVVTEMGFYRRPLNEHTYEVLIPKVFIGHFEKLFNGFCLEKLLLGMLRFAIRLRLVLSPGDANASIRQLLSQISQIWRQMKCTLESQSSICYIKSIHYSEATTFSKRSRVTFGSNEWKKIILETLEFEKIYIPVDTTSYSPDILFKLHSVDFQSSLMVGVACKGHWRSEGFLVPIHHQVLSEYLNIHCILIFVSTKLSSSVARELGHESRCYSSGSLIGDSFKIPANCELVILSEKDVEIFIEKDILDGLGRVFARTDKPTLDLIGTDFIQQICSRLAF
eukprot:jgi/Galph1/4138/GphlegSOOS_G2856.1